MIDSSLATVLCAATALGFGCARPKNTEIEAALVLLDVSDGSLVHPRCRELGPAIRGIRGRNFDFSVMLTGGSEQPEPATLIGWRRYRAHEERETFIAERVKECDQAISARRGSPIHRGILRAARELEDHCASIPALQETCGRRILQVHSDFRESENLDIQRALRASEALQVFAFDRVPADLELEFCGSRETSATTTTPGGDHLHAVWRAVLGRVVLHIEPTCARDP